MKSIKLLLIEDNPADIELVREALRAVELDPVLEVAADFEEARGHIEDTRLGGNAPEVILLDLNLPKGDGLALLQMFRASPRFERVPVIVVSSSSAARDRDRAAQLGASHYFRKPTDFEEFMTLGKIVRELMENRSELQ